MVLTPVLSRYWENICYGHWKPTRPATDTLALQKALEQATRRRHRDPSTTSGLRGRGGAGFRTGVKWSFIPQDEFLRLLRLTTSWYADGRNPVRAKTFR